MTLPIALYLVIGAVFGLATYTRRHLFSEGTAKPSQADSPGPADGRVMWTLICAGLWPLMVLTGVFSAWHRRSPRKR